jgi:hypothetical protein
VVHASVSMSAAIEEIRAWLPTIQPAFVAYFTVMLTVFRAVNRNERDRAWALTALTTPIVSAVGVIELLSWVTGTDTKMTNGIVYPTAMSNVMAEYLKAYFAMDLLYCGIWHPMALEFVDGWLHHTVYIAVLEHMVRHYETGFIRPFLVMEVPTAIRAWKMLVPQTATTAAAMNNWFAATFAAFRVVWPSYVITQIYAPTWIFLFAMSAIILQTMWFAKWIREHYRVYE